MKKKILKYSYLFITIILLLIIVIFFINKESFNIFRSNEAFVDAKELRDLLREFDMIDDKYSRGFFGRGVTAATRRFHELMYIVLFGSKIGHQLVDGDFLFQDERAGGWFK